jgi:hypothetical protein
MLLNKIMSSEHVTLNSRVRISFILQFFNITCEKNDLRYIETKEWMQLIYNIAITFIYLLAVVKRICATVYAFAQRILRSP